MTASLTQITVHCTINGQMPCRSDKLIKVMFYTMETSWQKVALWEKLIMWHHYKKSNKSGVDVPWMNLKIENSPCSGLCLTFLEIK